MVSSRSKARTSQASTPNNDEERELLAMMNRPAATDDGNSQPEDGDDADPKTGDKRPRDPEDDDNELTNGLEQPSTSANGNIVEYARRISKKLKPEQAHELELTASKPLAAQLLSVMAKQMELSNKVDRIVTSSESSFEVTKSLNTDIHALCRSIVISTKLSAYTGTIPSQHALNQIKIARYGIPNGIEKIPSSWEKVEQRVSYYFSQVRSKMKIEIAESVDAEDPKDRCLYGLARALCDECDRPDVTIGVMGRAAVMRKVYMTKIVRPKEKSKEKSNATSDDSDEEPEMETIYPNQGNNFWDKVDEKLRLFRTLSEGDKKALANAFTGHIEDDQKEYGQNSDTQKMEMEKQTRSQKQTEIDEAIDSGTV